MRLGAAFGHPEIVTEVVLVERQSQERWGQGFILHCGCQSSCHSVPKAKQIVLSTLSIDVWKVGAEFPRKCWKTGQRWSFLCSAWGACLKRCGTGGFATGEDDTNVKGGFSCEGDGL